MVLKFFALSFFICYAIVSNSGSAEAANKPDPKEKSATTKAVYYYDGSRCKILAENERSSFNGKTYESRSKCLAEHPDRNKTRKKARSQVNRKRAQVQKQRPTRVRSPTKSAGIPAKSSNPKPAEQFRRKVQANGKQSASGRASHKQKAVNKNRRKKVRVHQKTNTRKKSASNQISPNVNQFHAARPGGAAPGYGTKTKTRSGKKVRRRGGSKSAIGKSKNLSPPVNPHVMLNGGQPSVDNTNTKNGQKIRNHKKKPGNKSRFVKKRKLKSGNNTSSSPGNQTSLSNSAKKVRTNEPDRRLVYEPRASGEDGSCYWISRHTDGKQIIKSAEHWSKCYKYEYADPRKTTCRKVVIVPGGQSSATPETVPLKKCRKKRAGRRRVRIKGASSAAAAADKNANKTSTVVKPGQNSGNVMLGDQPNQNQTVDETSNQQDQQGQNQPVETNGQQGQQESQTASVETKFKYDVATKTCVPVTVPVNVNGGLRTKANQGKPKLGKNLRRNGRPPTRRTVHTPKKFRRKVASNGKKVRVRKVRVKKPTTAEQSRRTRNKRDATKNRRNKNVRKRARTSGQQRVSNVGRRRKSFRRKSAVDAEPKLYDSPEECQAENKPQGDEPTATEIGTNGISNATTASTAQNSNNGANSVTATEGGPIACKKRCWDEDDDFSYCIEVTEEECKKYNTNCFRLPKKKRQEKLDGTKPATHFIYHYKSYGWWYYYEVSEDECMTVGEKTCAPCSEYDVYGKYYIDGINEEPRSSKAPKTSKKPTSASQPEMVTQPMTQAPANNANPATSGPELPGRPDQPTAVDPDSPTEAPAEPEVPTEATTAVPTEQPVSEPDEPVPITSAAKSPAAKIEIKFKYDEATKTCVSVQVTVNGGGGLRTKAYQGQSKLILGENPLRNGRPPTRRTVHTPRNFRRKVASNGKKVRVRKVRVKKPAAVEKSRRTRNKRDTKSRRVYVRQRARTSGQKRVSNTGRRRKSFRWKSNAEPKLYTSTEECEAENKPQNVNVPGPGTNGINNTITGRTGQTINSGTNNATAPDVLVDVKCAQDCLTKKKRCWKTNICGTGDAPACEKMPASEADKLAPRTSDDVFIECRAGEDNDCGIKFCTGWDDRKCYTCLKNDADYFLEKFANNYEIKCQKNCFRETGSICKDAIACESHNDLVACQWVNKEHYDQELEKMPQNLWKIKCNDDGTGCKETNNCFDGDYCTVCDDRKIVDEIISRGHVHSIVAAPNGNGSMVGIAPGGNGNKTENVIFTIQDGKCVQVEVMQGDSPRRPRRYNRTKYPHVRFRRKKHGNWLRKKKNSKKVYKQRQNRKNRRRQKRQAKQPPTFMYEPECQKYLNDTKLQTNCPDGQKHNDDGVCEPDCPNDNYVWKPELNKCVDDYGCSPEEEYYSFDKECFPRCGENQTLNEDNECEDCPQGTIPNDENDCVAPEKPGTEKPVVPPPKEPEEQHKIVNGVCVPVGSAAANAEMMQNDQSPPVKSRKVPVRKSNKKRAPPKRRRRRRKGNSKVVRIRNKRQAANDSQIFISKQQCQEHLKTIEPPPKEPEKRHKIVNGVCVPVENAEMMQNDYASPVRPSIQQKVPVRYSHNKKAQPNRRRRRRKGNSKGVRVRNKRNTESKIFTSKQKCEEHLKTIKPCPAGRKQGADGSCTLDCPEGQMEDPNTKKCIAVPDCLEDHNWDPKRKQCVDKYGCTQKDDYIEGAKKCLPLCYVNEIRNQDYECEACPEGTSPTDENVCKPDKVEGEKVCSIVYGGREVCVTLGDVSACETKHTLGELVSQKLNPFKAYDALIYAWNKHKDTPIGEIIDGFGQVSNSIFSAPKKDLHLLNRFFRLVMRTEDDCEYLNRQGVKIHELRNCEFAECANDNEDGDGDDGDDGDDDEDE